MSGMEEPNFDNFNGMKWRTMLTWMTGAVVCSPKFDLDESVS